MTPARVRVEKRLREFIIVRFGRWWEEGVWSWLCSMSGWNVSEWIVEGEDREGEERTLL
jgi:hypothetical protein